MKLFVYGTLMKGYRLHPYMERAGTKFEGEATVEGLLFTQARGSAGQGFPMLVEPHDDAKAVAKAAGIALNVKGELYSVDSKLLSKTDKIEGYRSFDPVSSLYFRHVRTVVSEDGVRCSAWVYVWNQGLERLKLIPSGSWREYARMPVEVASGEEEL